MGMEENTETVLSHAQIKLAHSRAALVSDRDQAMKNHPSVSEVKKEVLAKRADSKKRIDKVVEFFFLFIALICASVIVFITVFIIYKGLLPFIGKSGVYDPIDFGYFWTGSHWQSDPTHWAVGYLAVNTLFLTLLSLVVSIPVSILTALMITRIAPRALSKIFQTGIELLAAIPSVIFGLFGMGFINPMVKGLADLFDLQTAGGNSLLSGVFVIALMSVPTITMMSTTAMKAVDPALIKASVALGATKLQTDFKVVVRTAQSGIFAGIILGIGRALGEATAIQMVIGNAMSGPSFNPFGISATLTTQMLMGIGEATPGTIGYDIRFSAGALLIIILFVVDIFLNSLKDQMYDRMVGRTHVSWFKKFFNKLFPPEKRSLKKEKE